MIRRLLALGVVGAILVGCGAGDVSSDDVHAKEKQIADASAKLNSGQPSRDEPTDQ